VAIWLDQASGDFEQRFAAFLTTKREMSEDVNVTVRAIIDDMRARGDVALAEYSKKFEGIDFAETPMRVTEAEIDAAVEASAGAGAPSKRSASMCPAAPPLSDRRC
jgi:histidinol dehydrogenase